MNFNKKYAPVAFDDLVFANSAARDICETYVLEKPYKHLMLWGPPGTAKTATARVIVQSRYRLADYDGQPIEYNGADFTKETFEKLYGDLNYLSLRTRDPIVLINEFDELDKGMQAKFRAWTEEWDMMKFVVTTNEKPGIQGVVQRITPSLISRFERVELAPPSLDDWLPRAQAIFAAEGHEVSTEDLKFLLSNYGGDVRDMLPIIERTLAMMPAPQLVQSRAKPTLQVVSSQKSE